MFSWQRLSVISSDTVFRFLGQIYQYSGIETRKMRNRKNYWSDKSVVTWAADDDGLPSGRRVRKIESLLRRNSLGIALSRLHRDDVRVANGYYIAGSPALKQTGINRKRKCRASPRSRSRLPTQNRTSLPCVQHFSILFLFFTFYPKIKIKNK